jgi:hypothetical protein
MKRVSLYLVGLILIGAAAAAITVTAMVSKHHDDHSFNASQNATTVAYKKACNIFTLLDAKKLLGDTAKGRSTDTSSTDMAVTSCTYTQDAGSNVPVSSSKSAALLVRAPRTDGGASSNRGQFAQLKPADAPTVSGYGSSAYWDAGHGQLDILKNDTWYIVSYGPVTPADRTLDQAKQLADTLISKM